MPVEGKEPLALAFPNAFGPVQDDVQAHCVSLLKRTCPPPSPSGSSDLNPGSAGGRRGHCTWGRSHCPESPLT